MPDDRSDPNRPSPSDPHSSFGEGRAPFEEEGATGPDDPPGASGALPGGLSASLALQMGRSWIQQHQKAAMLGALAAGVVLGSLLRD